jgi:hypothetical protein
LIYLASRNATARANPTPPCVVSRFALGQTTFWIERIARAADGSIAVPPDTPDIAYQVEDANTNYLFALSPTPNNLALKTALKNGDFATIFWADCTATTFAISAIETDQLINSVQSNQGMVVFIQTDFAGKGFVVKGSELEPLVIVTDTPLPPGTL